MIDMKRLQAELEFSCSPGIFSSLSIAWEVLSHCRQRLMMEKRQFNGENFSSGARAVSGSLTAASAMRSAGCCCWVARAAQHAPTSPTTCGNHTIAQGKLVKV